MDVVIACLVAMMLPSLGFMALAAISDLIIAIAAMPAPDWMLFLISPWDVEVRTTFHTEAPSIVTFERRWTPANPPHVADTFIF